MLKKKLNYLIIMEYDIKCLTVDLVRLPLQNKAKLFIIGVKKIRFILPYSQVSFTLSCLILSIHSILADLKSI